MITWRTISVPHNRLIIVWSTRRSLCHSIIRIVAGASSQRRMHVSHPEAEAAPRAYRRICCSPALAYSCSCSRAAAWAFNHDPRPGSCGRVFCVKCTLKILIKLGNCSHLPCLLARALFVRFIRSVCVTVIWGFRFVTWPHAEVTNTCLGTLPPSRIFKIATAPHDPDSTYIRDYSKTCKLSYIVFNVFMCALG